MRISTGIAVTLALAGLLPAACSKGAAARDAGDWVAFYTSARDGSQYYYDRAALHNGSDQLEARWKRVGPQNATTFQQLEIHCRARVFTERSTHIIEQGKPERDVPAAELWVDHPIEANTSTDVFARRFCPA